MLAEIEVRGILGTACMFQLNCSVAFLKLPLDASEASHHAPLLSTVETAMTCCIWSPALPPDLQVAVRACSQ